LPRPQLGLIAFNDRHCRNAAELRSVILKARRLADDHAEQKRAAAAVKTWLLAQIEKGRAARSAGVAKTLDEPPTPERLAA
jgi:hypothetical protein